MADKQVNFQINITGNAEGKLNKVSEKTKSTKDTFAKLGDASLRLNNIYQLLSGAISKVASVCGELIAGYNAQIEAEAKLEKVMRNTMGAGKAELQSILQLTAAQQKLGVVGDEVQLAGAQELGTYLTKTASLKTLIPVMNDMLAQQYGLNATQEQAVTIGSMLGKVMDGQVGALSRYGYRFDEAQEKVLKFGTEEQRVATLAEVVESAVGGVNQQLALTDAGRAKQLANNWGDFKEQIGGLAQQLGSQLIPVASKAVATVQSWVEVPLVETIAREKSEVNALANSLIEGNLREDERRRIINELNAKYPDFLANIDLETDATEQLRQKLSDVNAEYDARMRKAAYTRMRDKLDEQYADQLNDVVSLETSIQARKDMQDLQQRRSKGLLANIERQHGLAPGTAVMNWYAGEVGLQGPNGFQRIPLTDKERAESDALFAEYQALSDLTSGSAYDEQNLKKAQQRTREYRAKVKAMDKIIEDMYPTASASTQTDDTTTSTAVADSALSSAVATISGSAKNVKNFNITINDGLVKEVTNNFSSSDDDPASASAFMDRLTTALQMIVNDVNYAAQ